MNIDEKYKDDIDKIDRAMAQEGMHLTDEDKKNLKEVMTGEKTYNEKISEIIKQTISSGNNEVKRK